MNSLAWAQVMCIFQLPAITGLRTPSSPTKCGANLRRCSDVLSDNARVGSKNNEIAGQQLPSATGLDSTVDRHGSSLNVLFRLTTGPDPAHPLQVLIKFHRQR